MELVLGFDPGGTGQFGWAVLELAEATLPRARAIGSSAHAKHALEAAREHVGPHDTVRAAGIDSPMYWTDSGDRVAEQRVRAAMKSRGATNVGGTVQHPNSLRGACVVQGPTLALLLRQAFEDLPITEAHPKAMLWLLDVATRERPAASVRNADLQGLVTCGTESCEHERDAILGAYAASQMLAQASGWLNLVVEEQRPIFIAGPVGYWLPMAAHQ